MKLTPAQVAAAHSFLRWLEELKHFSNEPSRFDSLLTRSFVFCVSRFTLPACPSMAGKALVEAACNLLQVLPAGTIQQVTELYELFDR